MSNIGSVTQISLEKIQLNGGSQTRARLCTDTVKDYAEEYKRQAEPGYNGEHFPPVVLFFDGTYWMSDGFHRARARERAGFKDIPAVIREGTVRDALLYSAGCNSSNGLRRSREDKATAVQLLLKDPEWAQASSSWIASICNVSHTFVDKLRAPTCNDASSEDQARKGRDGKTRRTRKSQTRRERQPGEDDKSGAKSRNGQPSFFLKEFYHQIGRAGDQLDRLVEEFGLVHRSGRVRETPEHQAILRQLDAVKEQVKKWYEELNKRRKQETA
jgi:hypothetical protein